MRRGVPVRGFDAPEAARGGGAVDRTGRRRTDLGDTIGGGARRHRSTRCRLATVRRRGRRRTCTTRHTRTRPLACVHRAVRFAKLRRLVHRTGRLSLRRVPRETRDRGPRLPSASDRASIAAWTPPRGSTRRAVHRGGDRTRGDRARLPPRSGGRERARDAPPVAAEAHGTNVRSGHGQTADDRCYGLHRSWFRRSSTIDAGRRRRRRRATRCWRIPFTARLRGRPLSSPMMPTTRERLRGRAAAAEPGSSARVARREDLRRVES